MQPLAWDGVADDCQAAVSELERVFRKQDFRRMRIHGQFNLGFILATVDRDLFIVDQHAADEKFNFERLRATTVLNQCASLPCPICFVSSSIATLKRFDITSICGEETSKLPGVVEYLLHRIYH
jgi:DNA mismatch repair ATPase MutL